MAGTSSIMKEVYLLSGLGADKRVYQYLDLVDYKLNYIEWTTPGKEETIAAYAQRLLTQIPTQRPVLIGVSFGGIMAVEIGKLIPTEKILLISSAKSKEDLPFYYQWAGRLGLHRVVPPGFFKQVNTVTYWFFGISGKKEKILLKRIIEDTDLLFLQWAIDKLLNWRSVEALPHITNIHGSRDRVLPSGKPDLLVKDGGHLMLITHASEMSEIIRNWLL